MAGENAPVTSAQPASSVASASLPTGSQQASQSQQVSSVTQGSSQTAESSKSDPLKTPLIPDPKAFLDRARQRLGFSTSKPADPAKPSTPAKPADTAVPAVTASDQKPADQKPADGQGQAKPPETKPSDTSDDIAARVAKFSREQREFEARKREYAEQQARDRAQREESARQQAAKLAQAETVEKATKAIESGDVVGAMRLLKSDLNPSALALQMLEQLQREDERPMSQAEVDRIVSEKLKAEQAAREKSEEEKRKSDEEKKKAEEEKVLGAAKDNYVTACHQEFSKEKFPFVAKRGIKREELLDYAMSVRDDRGHYAPPSPGDLLKHFEDRYKEEAVAEGYELVPKAARQTPAQASPSLNPSALVQDQGGRLASGEPPKSLAAKRAEIRHRLRVGGHQT